MVRSVAELKHRGFTVAPGIEWKSGARGVSVSHKFRAGTLKGSYAHDSQTAGLEYDFKPFKVQSLIDLQKVPICQLSVLH